MDRGWLHARSQLHWWGALSVFIALAEEAVSWGLQCVPALPFSLDRCLILFALGKIWIVHGSAANGHIANGQPMERRNSLRAMLRFPDKKVFAACPSISKSNLLAPHLQWQPRDGKGWVCSRIPYLFLSRTARKQTQGFSFVKCLSDFTDVSADLR